tara:strand:+ start:306 stop:617 length:312 start_codon:yes stop_codon:yes gene_type:complete
MKNIKEYLESEDTEIRLYHKNGEIALHYYLLESGWWIEGTYDTNGMVLTSKDSHGYWARYTRDEDGKQLTYENSKGNKRGFDVEEMTMEEVCKALGKTIKITK